MANCKSVLIKGMMTWNGEPFNDSAASLVIPHKRKELLVLLGEMNLPVSVLRIKYSNETMVPNKHGGKNIHAQLRH